MLNFYLSKVNAISKTVNEEELFKSVTLGLDEGERVGIVGKNGEGKTTFLKLLTREIYPDEGDFSLNNDVDIFTLEQQIKFNDNSTIESFLYECDAKKIKLLKEYDEALRNNDQKQYQRVYEEVLKHDCFNLSVDYNAHLSLLNLNKDKSTLIKNLSGGEVKKVALARALALKVKLLILDEPTNHLDIKTIEHLESYLINYKGSIIIVTHDRYILNSVCTTIWELDRKRFYRHPGCYEAYLERRAERIDHLQKEQDRISSILRRELKWLSRGPQARTGKDKNRKDRIEKLLDSVESVQDVKQNEFSSITKRVGKKILDIENLSYQGLFDNFSYQFKKGDKIGIIGDNGSGKTTLLDLLTLTKAPTSGKIDVGVNTHFGYYDQTSRALVSNKTALEYIDDIASRIFTGVGELSSSQFLEYFGFNNAKMRTQISKLSGGEKRRLYLLSKLALNPNFLILDEPTNDLDIKSMENLEEYISSFPGCVLIVSHDRAFLDCTCSTLFVLKDNRITLFPGTYTQYKEKEELSDIKKVKQKEDPTPKKREKRGLSFKEKRELEDIEIKIDKLSSLISLLECTFSTNETTELGSLSERSKKYDAALKELDHLESRYLELLELEG